MRAQADRDEPGEGCTHGSRGRRRCGRVGCRHGPGTSSLGATDVGERGSREIIRAPRSEMLVMHLPVHMAIRVPAGTTHLWLRVGGRNVTSRFRAAGSLRTANLTRRDGLQYGENEVSVLVQRRGHSPESEARSFILVRSQSGFVHARINPGPVTSLNLWMADPSSLAAIHRDRIVRVWLNGRSVTGSLDTSEVTHVTGSLSASHRVRRGPQHLADPRRRAGPGSIRAAQPPLPSVGTQPPAGGRSGRRNSGSRLRAA